MTPSVRKDVILVVDDSPDSLGMIHHALDQAGLTALVALGANMQVAVLADPEIAVTPTLHIVNGVKRALGLGHGRFLGGCVLCRIMPAGAAGGQK